MAQFLVTALDNPASADVRTAYREAHLAHIRGGGTVRIAGPILDDNGAVCGSMLVVEAADKDAAAAFCAADPFSAAGLYASVEIRPFRLTYIAADQAP